MKILLLSLYLLVSTAFSVNADVEVKKMIARTSKGNIKNIKLIKTDSENTAFEYYTKKGKLYIKGSDNIALSRGFYDYVKQNQQGIYTWSGSNITLPAKFEDIESRKVVSPFDNHYYFNVVTYGYSTPYWDWNRWEQEIDWMALHGINMPLALVGYEAILARVWKRFGLTDDEINSYFGSPAHLPWVRMGNMSGIDGPLNDQWYEDQIALQHNILKRMKSLDMKPICMGFPGFVPEAFKRIYPDLNLIKTNWAGAFHNWMLSPQEELFSQIATAFIQEWEKEFGKNDNYLVDSFNEMDIPFPPKESKERYDLLASYGDIVYKSIQAANPEATWVMQGWMFGYQRYIWDYKSLAALLSKVPDDKMILLDLAVDYNKHFWHSEVNWDFHKGFQNKQWVYSVIPNMGGKVGMTGVLDFYANGHLEALNSPNKGNLIAHGTAPEGIENNEVLYELYTDAGWSNTPINIDDWYRNYSENRYGKIDPNIEKSLKTLRKSVYGTFTDHPRYNWQFRPGRTKNGSININDAFFKGIEQFAAAAPHFKDNTLYKTDLAEYTALYLGGKAEQLIKMIDQEYLLGDQKQAVQYEKTFEHIMLAMDSLLLNHPTLNMPRWLDFAERSGKTAEQKAQYLTNARRIITIWGPPVDDYSARVWGGLIGEYYLPRWKHYFAAKKSGVPFDYAKWEKNWVENHVSSHTKPEVDIIEMSTRLIHASQEINQNSLINTNPNDIGYWNIGENNKREFSYQVSAIQLSKLKEITIKSIRKTGAITVLGYELIADGNLVASSKSEKNLDTNDSVSYTVDPLSLTTANNGLILKIKIRSSKTATAAGVISL